MKRIIILSIALIAALASGFAVFQQLTKQMNDAPSVMADESSSRGSIAEMLSSSNESTATEGETSNDGGKIDTDELMQDLTVPRSTSDDGVIAIAQSSVASSMNTKKTSAVYAAFNAGVIGNGQTSVLFFYARWCPECKEADGILKELYKNGNPSYSMYRVDFDTENDLKKTYGIVRQTSFVRIDGTGKAIQTLISPNKEALLNLVK